MRNIERKRRRGRERESERRRERDRKRERERERERAISCSVMGLLRLVGSLKLKVSFEKEPYKRDDILQKRPIILRSLLIVASP